MENFNDKSKKNILKGRGILVTSILMVVVAVAMFVTAGFGNVSYAAEATGTKLSTANNITSLEPTTQIRADTYAEGSQTRQYVLPVYNVVADGDTAHPVQIFCLDRNTDLAGNASYAAKDDSSVQFNPVGLADLLELGAEDDGYYSDSITITKDSGTVTAEDKNMARIWVFQTAIWVYQHRLAVADSSNPYGVKMNDSRWPEICTDNTCQTLRTVNTISYGPVGAELSEVTNLTVKYGNYPVSSLVSMLVTSAEYLDRTYQAGVSSDFGLTADSDQKVDGDYFVSGAIHIDYDAPVEYSIKITSGLEGAKLIDKDGKEIAETDVLSRSQAVYIKVPKKSVTEKNNKVSIKATATLEESGVRRYGATGSQTIAEFVPKNVPREAALAVPFKVEVDVPDTGMTTAQTIYFVGLVVLLCGVGIVYANVKPKEAE